MSPVNAYQAVSVRTSSDALVTRHAELVKRIAFLTGRGPNVLDKNKGPTAEELLAEEIRKRQVADEVVDIVGMSKEMVNGRQGAQK